VRKSERARDAQTFASARTSFVICGRFTYKLTWEEGSAVSADARSAARNNPARYNVCPTDPVDTIVERDGKRELVSMRWLRRAWGIAATIAKLPGLLRRW
jgi:putative SOS response-associated peptidase YedK